MNIKRKQIRFTLTAYLILWFIGAVFGIFSVIYAIQSGAHGTPAFVNVVIFGCFAALTLHQYHVYLSIHKLEEGHSFGSPTYVGSRCEIILRCLVFVALLLVGGKMEGILDYASGHTLQRQGVYALGLVIVFSLLLIWDVAGVLVDYPLTKPRWINIIPAAVFCIRRSIGVFVALFTAAFWDNVSSILHRVWISDKYSVTWFIISDVLGLLISVTFLAIVSKRLEVEAIDWWSFVVVFYIVIMLLRFRAPPEGAAIEASA